jgi:hypothetical protein
MYSYRKTGGIKVKNNSRGKLASEIEIIGDFGSFTYRSNGNAHKFDVTKIVLKHPAEHILDGN